MLIIIIASGGFAFSRFAGFRLPLAVDTSLVMLLFYGIGHSLRNLELFNKYIKSSLPVKAISLVCSVIVTCAIDRLNGSTNVRNIAFGNPLLYVIGASAGSFGVMSGAMISERILRNTSIYNSILYIGRNTIIVLYIHRLYIGLISVFLWPYLNLTGYKRYMLYCIFVVVFFAGIAYPVCRQINAKFPIMLGKKLVSIHDREVGKE